MVEHVYRAQAFMTRGMVLAAGWALFIFSFVVTFNVVLRKIFSVTLQGIDEYGGYALAIAASIGFGQAAIERVHIRIDIATRRLPTALRSLSVSVALITLFCTISYIFMNAFMVAKTSFEMGSVATSVLRTPLWMPQGIWAVALGWAALVLLVQCILSVSAVVHRRWSENLERFDTASVEEEVRRELGEASRRLSNDLNEDSR